MLRGMLTAGLILLASILPAKASNGVSADIVKYAVDTCLSPDLSASKISLDLTAGGWNLAEPKDQLDAFKAYGYIKSVRESSLADVVDTAEKIARRHIDTEVNDLFFRHASGEMVVKFGVALVVNEAGRTFVPSCLIAAHMVEPIDVAAFIDLTCEELKPETAVRLLDLYRCRQRVGDPRSSVRVAHLPIAKRIHHPDFKSEFNLALSLRNSAAETK